MTKNKITIAIFLSSLFALALTGCAESSQPSPTAPADSDGSISKIGSVQSDYIKLPDGRTVLCVSNWEASHGGLSCDWDNAK